jgi:competence protein ComEA
MAAVTLMAVVASVGWLLRAKAVPIAVAAAPGTATLSAPSATPSALASATPTPPPTVTATILVHVIGAVLAPGLVKLPQGARVADALAAAGGLRGDADPAELNLAAVVSDGSQIVIGTKSAPRGEVREGSASGGVSAGGATASAVIDLNTATLSQLDTLPGVGPVTAQAILDYRTKHGRFTKVEELQEVDGIGTKTYAQIAPHVRV